MSARAQPHAADPDNPGRSVDRPINGVLEPAWSTQELTQPDAFTAVPQPLYLPEGPGGDGTPAEAHTPATADELLLGAVDELSDIGGRARALLQTASDRTEDKYIKAEIRKVLTRVDWLATWSRTYNLERERSRLLARLEEIGSELGERPT